MLIVKEHATLSINTTHWQFNMDAKKLGGTFTIRELGPNPCLSRNESRDAEPPLATLSRHVSKRAAVSFIVERESSMQSRKNFYHLVHLAMLGAFYVSCYPWIHLVYSAHETLLTSG